MYELNPVGRVRDVPREEWDGLAGGDASPFVEWTWLDCLEEAGCVGQKAGWLPVHLVLKRDKKTVALAPAYAKTNSEGEFVFDWSWADFSHRAGVPYYPKLVLAVPFTPATGSRLFVAEGEDRAALTFALTEGIRKWSAEIGASGAHVLFPPAREAAEWRAAGFSERYGVQFHWARQGARTWDEFLSRFTSKRRNQIKREAAQPAKDGVVIQTLRPEELTPAVVRAMYELYGNNVDKHYYGRRYLNLRFFELVAERFKDRLVWVVARKGGEIVAGAFNAVKNDHLYGRYWGSSIELPFLHFNVCYYHGIRECIERGIDVFEPGAGGEHKRARGFDPTLTHSAHWIADPRVRSVVDSFLERERQSVKDFIEGGDEGDPT